METKNVAVDFSHRLTNRYSNDSAGLVDNIGLMTERATGVLHLISCQFQSANNTRSSDDILCMAIDSVMQEIEDIQATVTAYYEAEKAKNKA